MQFLADVELICEECKGTRFKSSILDIRYHGLNIHEVLQLTVDEAMQFFHAAPRVVSRMKVLSDVGLGYLRLGQSATTLSGGEAQRVKLAAHLAQASCEGTLYIFDEPTTGLHFDDIAKLLAAFQRLIENGGVATGDRAQSRCDPRGRLDHRSRSRRRRQGRLRGGDGHTGADRESGGLVDGEVFEIACRRPIAVGGLCAFEADGS